VAADEWRESILGYWQLIVISWLKRAVDYRWDYEPPKIEPMEINSVSSGSPLDIPRCPDFGLICTLVHNKVINGSAMG
jgi:hypothetical protein